MASALSRFNHIPQAAARPKIVEKSPEENLAAALDSITLDDIELIDTDMSLDMVSRIDEAAREDTKPLPGGVVIQRVPRTTLVDFVRKPLDEEFTFCTQANKGTDFVACMRVVLSRTRAKALGVGKHLDEWKMHTMRISHLQGYDEIVLLRSKTRKSPRSSVYTDLLAAFEETMK